MTASGVNVAVKVSRLPLRTASLNRRLCSVTRLVMTCLASCPLACLPRRGVRRRRAGVFAGGVGVGEQQFLVDDHGGAGALGGGHDDLRRGVGHGRGGTVVWPSSLTCTAPSSSMAHPSVSARPDGCRGTGWV